MNQTAGDGFAKSTATPITTGGISDAKTRSGSSGTQSFALVSNQNKQKSSTKEKSNENEGKTVALANLNPITKNYLKKIEKTYVKNERESADSSKSPQVSDQLFEKYKAMRDTAIDIGKWINNGVGKVQNHASQTKYDTPFLE
jgi:hypothetical protein